MSPPPPSAPAPEGPIFRLGVCDHFLAETQAAVAAEGWTDVEVFNIPAACARPWPDWQTLGPLVRAGQTSSPGVCLAGGACLRVLAAAPQSSPPCAVHALGRCCDWIIGGEAADRWVRQGAFLATPGWILHWREHVKEWGFDESTARQFFAESMKRLVLLDTGIHPGAAQCLAEFAAFAGLPSEIAPAGLEMYRLRLRVLVLEERLAQERRAHQAKAAENARKLADHAMIQDLILRIGSLRTEKQVIEAVMDLNSMLFAPESCHYLQLAGHAPPVLHARPPVPDPAVYQARLAALSSDHAWTPSGRGFTLRIGSAESPVGIVEVEGMAFAQYRQHYLSLALSMGRICGLAIENARAFETIDTTIQKLTTALLERRHAEEQLREARNLETVGALAGGIAHEFNNILAATLLQLGLLTLSPNLDSQTQASLADLRRLAQRAAALTRQIILFSRRSILQHEEFNPNDWLDSRLDSIRRLTGPHIHVTLQTEGPPLRLKADRRLLEQVLSNLCANARDAMPGGGLLEISSGPAEISAALAARNPNRIPGHYWRLAVRDTGCGIEESILKRIFDPFFTTKPIGEGSGLGLATAQGVVKQQHGWIEVESQRAQGSTFTVYLPLPASPAPAPAPHTARQPGVLLVEEDPRIRHLAAACLRSEGWQVFEAGDPSEAIAHWRPHSPQISLLVTDMVLRDGLTGLELAERLRADAPALPVIISCAHSLDLMRQAAAATPGVTCLPKPFEVTLLLQAARDALLKRET